MKSFWARALLVIAIALFSSSVFSLTHMPGDRVADQAMQNDGFIPFSSDQNADSIEAISPFIDYDATMESIQVATWGWVPHGNPGHHHYWKWKHKRKFKFVCFTPFPKKKPNFSRTLYLPFLKAIFLVYKIPRRFQFGKCTDIPSPH